MGEEDGANRTKKRKRRRKRREEKREDSPSVGSFALRFEIMQRLSFSGSYSYAIGTPASVPLTLDRLRQALLCYSGINFASNAYDLRFLYDMSIFFFYKNSRAVRSFFSILFYGRGNSNKIRLFLYPQRRYLVTEHSRSFIRRVR